MICLSSQLPTLQVGRYQLSDYDTSWIHDSIQTAFSSAGIGDQSIPHEIYAGILYYLKNECPWTLLKIEKLYQRLDILLEKIGFSHLSNSLPRYGPPIEVSVTEIVETCDYPMELTLLRSLQLELETLRNYGVYSITLCDVELAVKVMIPAKKWTKRREALKQELLVREFDFNGHHNPEHE